MLWPYLKASVASTCGSGGTKGLWELPADIIHRSVAARRRLGNRAPVDQIGEGVIGICLWIIVLEGQDDITIQLGSVFILKIDQATGGLLLTAACLPCLFL